MVDDEEKNNNGLNGSPDEGTRDRVRGEHHRFFVLLSSMNNVEEGHRRQQMIASVSFSRFRAFANTMMKKKKKNKREKSALLFSTAVCVHREIIMRTRSVPMSFVLSLSLSLSFFGSIAELQ